jgi:hypothetical protein
MPRGGGVSVRESGEVSAPEALRKGTSARAALSAAIEQISDVESR